MLATVSRVIREVGRPRTGHPHRDLAGSTRRERRRVDLSSRREGLLGVRGHRAAAGGHRHLRGQVVCRLAPDTGVIGIRIAIGARPRALLWQVLREGGRITVYGLAIGVLLAVGAGRLLQNVLYGVSGVEPVVLLTAPLILLGASLLASLIPALRATSVDPMVALRSGVTWSRANSGGAPASPHRSHFTTFNVTSTRTTSPVSESAAFVN